MKGKDKIVVCVLTFISPFDIIYISKCDISRQRGSGRRYGCTYKKSIRTHDGNRILHPAVPEGTQSRLWHCPAGKVADRRGNTAESGDYVRQPVKDGKRRSDSIYPRRGEAKNLSDHGTGAGGPEPGAKENPAPVSECRGGNPMKERKTEFHFFTIMDYEEEAAYLHDMRRSV